MSAIPLNLGLNLVGLPLMDSRITRVSDLFALEGIVNNVAAIVVTDNGEFKLVGRAGDAGDIPVTGGQSFILIVQGAANAYGFKGVRQYHIALLWSAGVRRVALL